MASFNKVILVGNLTRDPEIRYLNNGSALCKFAIAVNKWTPKGDKVLFVNIVAWNRGKFTIAETCNKYLRKGMSVLVEGELEMDEYEDRQGISRKSTQINIDKMEMLGKRGDYADKPRADEADGSFDRIEDTQLDDEIPF